MTWHIWLGLTFVVIGVVWGIIAGALGGAYFDAGLVGNAVLSVLGFGLIFYRLFIVWVLGKK